MQGRIAKAKKSGFPILENQKTADID